MAFQDRAQGLCSQFHLTAVKRPALLGVATLLGLLLIAAALTLAFPQGASTFEVQAAVLSPTGDVPADQTVSAEGEAPGVADEAAAGAATSPGGDVVLPAASAEPEPTLCVHVDGRVARPGVYYLASGSRVIDAVDAAGGLVPGAVTESVNLALVLADGQQVIIPDADSAPTGSVSDAPADAPAASGGLVNINTASVGELVTLKGVGEATAEKIVADREANGPFSNIEDLKRVSGIGEKKFEALREAICV